MTLPYLPLVWLCPLLQIVSFDLVVVNTGINGGCKTTVIANVGYFLEIGRDTHGSCPSYLATMIRSSNNNFRASPIVQLLHASACRPY